MKNENCCKSEKVDQLFKISKHINEYGWINGTNGWKIIAP
jgi:hypothetical protein